MSAPRRINAAIARQAVFWATTITAVSFRLFVPSTGPVEDAFSVPLALFERAHLCNTLSPLRGSVPQRLLFSLPPVTHFTIFSAEQKIFGALLYSEVKTALTQKGVVVAWEKQKLSSLNCLMYD
jgi:hypothetical protein